MVDKTHILIITWKVNSSIKRQRVADWVKEEEKEEEEAGMEERWGEEKGDWNQPCTAYSDRSNSPEK